MTPEQIIANYVAKDIKTVQDVNDRQQQAIEAIKQYAREMCDKQRQECLDNLPFYLSERMDDSILNTPLPKRTRAMSLQEQIDETQRILTILVKKHREEAIASYRGVVGRYWQLTRGMCVKVEKIESVYTDEIVVSGIIIDAGGDNFHISRDACNFSIDPLPAEITEQEFKDFYKQELERVSKAIMP